MSSTPVLHHSNHCPIYSITLTNSPIYSTILTNYSNLFHYFDQLSLQLHRSPKQYNNSVTLAICPPLAVSHGAWMQELLTGRCPDYDWAPPGMALAREAGISLVQLWIHQKKENLSQERIEDDGRQHVNENSLKTSIYDK